MAHTFQTKHYTFIANSDLSGNVEIVNKDGKRFWIMGNELIEYVAHHLRNERIAKLEQMTAAELLGIKP